jgi:drug/metabolite transporter (DMT)-like permease
MLENPSIAAAASRAGRLALFALIAGATSLGFSPIFVRLSELGPTASAFYRPFLALPLLWLWMDWTYRQIPAARRPVSRADYRLMALAGVFFAGDLAFWHWSIKFTTVANATLFATSAPIFVTLASWVLFGERFTATFMAGMGFALLGGAVLMGESLIVDLEHLLGDGLGLITAIFLAAYILTVKRLRDRFSTATIMMWTSVTTAATLFPLAWLSGESLAVNSLYGLWVLLGLALVAHIGGQGLFAYALAHLPAGFSSVGLLLEAVAAAVCGWVILGEALSGWQMMGGAVILSGIVLARLGSR